MRFSGLYLDSNVPIYALKGNDEELREAFRSLFKAINFFQLHTSKLTLAELLVDPHRRGDEQLIARYPRLFQTSSNGFIKVIPISNSILEQAASFRGRQMRFLERKPSLLDCIHVASAYDAGCSHFMTSDGRLKLWDQIKKVSADVSGISGVLADLG